MSQELTPAQLERIKQQRAQRFKDMGFPATAGQMADIPVENMPQQRVYAPPAPIIESVAAPQYDNTTQQKVSVEVPNESNVSQQILTQLAEERAQRQNAIYTAPRDKLSALEAIRRGVKKQEFGAFIKAETHGASGNQLPEPKVGKRRQVRPGQYQEKSQNAVPVESFKTAKSAEADMLESMFTDKSPGINVSSSGVIHGNLIETDENYSNIGPSFDPVAHLKRKAAEKGVQLDLPRNNQPTSQVFQTENSNQISQMMLMIESMMKNQQKNYDLEALKAMMEVIAKKVAEDTMKKVLREYVDSQKKKNVFEVVNKEKNIIKSDGKYYQLKQVTPTNKL